jgi:hypothetical protein
VGGPKPEPLINSQGGICLHHPQGDRPAGAPSFLDQSFYQFRPNALPAQTFVNEHLAEEGRVVFAEALQSTDIVRSSVTIRTCVTCQRWRKPAV